MAWYVLSFFIFFFYLHYRVNGNNFKSCLLGRLTLTNYALYFEASGILSYEDALKLDLSKDVQKSVKPTVTGPWGAPLFDKAIVYQSSEM